MLPQATKRGFIVLRIIIFTYMQEQQYKIIIYSDDHMEKQNRRIVSIQSSITIEELREIVKNELNLTTHYFNLYFHTYNLVFLPLERQYFDYFRNNLDLNKLVKVKWYKPLEKSRLSVQAVKRKIERKPKETTPKTKNGSKSPKKVQIKTIGSYTLKSDSICSFFAQDIRKSSPFFQILRIDTPQSLQAASKISNK